MNPIAVAVSLAGLAAGTYTDLRTREVPDWINYSLIFAGFGISLIISIVSWSIMPLVYSVMGFSALFVLAYVMYYTGQWGGGDSKMIMGLGALIGIQWPIEGIPFLASFVVYSVMFGAVYGLFWSSTLAIIKRKAFWPEFKTSLKARKNLKIALVCMAAAAAVAAIFLPTELKVIVLMLACLIIFSFYMFVFVKSVEKVCMIKKVTPEKLTLGDWIAKDVKVGRKLIVGPKTLGVEQEHIDTLVKLHKQGKVKHVYVKEGIPFVPSFLAAFILSYFLGIGHLLP